MPDFNGAQQRIAELLGIQQPEVADKLRTLRKELDCGNDVQLGWIATQLGLLDDAVDELAATGLPESG